jgi:hypothetical protein
MKKPICNTHLQWIAMSDYVSYVLMIWSFKTKHKFAYLRRQQCSFFLFFPLISAFPDHPWPMFGPRRPRDLMSSIANVGDLPSAQWRNFNSTQITVA